MSDHSTAGWDKIFISMAKLMAEQSTCNRLKVGAILTRNKRIIGSGYNGVPAGWNHCEETNKDLDYRNKCDCDKHHQYSLNYEVHAEMNAIIDMAKRNESPEGATIYITTAPCHNCAKMIIAAGIKRVVFLDAYDKEEIKSRIDLDLMKDESIWYDNLSGINILQIANVEVEHVRRICDDSTN